MIAWLAGPATPHSAATGIAAQNHQPVGARPYNRKPSAPQPRPNSTERFSPSAPTMRFTRPPCTMIDSTPTISSVQPTMPEPHPYR